MRRPAFLIAAAAALALALAPALVEARPGGGSSSGSRGSRTYSAPPPTQTAPGTARPMDRTMTPPSTPQQPGYAGAPRPGAPAAAPSRSGTFMAGLAGGLLGAGLFGMMTGHGMFGGMSGGAGFLGLLLQLALIGGIVWLVLRLVRGARQPAVAGPQGMAREMHGQPQGGYGGGRPMPAQAPVKLAQSDFQAFEQLLLDVNAAWSRKDLTALRGLSTPEMTNFFAQDLRDLEARGWRNETRDLRFETGDLSEAWNEDGQDYATVAMRFSLLDATFDRDNRVVEGSTTQRQTTTELWTFVRQAPSGRWLLSAIQQTAPANA